MEVANRLASFVVENLTAPESAMHIARLSMLDWVAVATNGQHEPVTCVVRDLIQEEGGAEQAYAVGLERFVPARAAALLNGTASHALDYDDTHFAYLGHPSVAVLPAILAIADKILQVWWGLRRPLPFLKEKWRLRPWVSRSCKRSSLCR